MKLINSLILALLLMLSSIGFSAETININTADKGTMMSVIKGVGEKKAEAIIQYREENGPFESIDDLVKVKGIGQGILDENREKLSTSK